MKLPMSGDIHECRGTLSHKWETFNLAQGGSDGDSDFYLAQRCKCEYNFYALYILFVLLQITAPNHNRWVLQNIESQCWDIAFAWHQRKWSRFFYAFLPHQANSEMWSSSKHPVVNLLLQPAHTPRISIEVSISFKVNAYFAIFPITSRPAE